MEERVRGNHAGRWAQKGLTVLCIFALAFVFSLQCSTNIWNVGVSSTDSSVFQYVARVMLEGGMPYRDTFDHKGPLLYLINVAGMVISKWRGVWLMELATLFASFAAIYRIARIRCGRVGAMLVVFSSAVPMFSYFQGGNYVEEYAMPFIGAAIWIFADYFLNGRINRRRLMLCGLSFGAVCLLRINMVVIWAVMCLAVLIQCVRAREYKQLGFFLAYFILGFVLIAAPIMLWLAVNGAFSAFVRDYFIFNFQYAADLEGLTLTKRAEIFVFFLKNEFVLLTLIFSVYLAAKKRTIFHAANVVFVIGTLMVTAMSGRMYPHYAMILVPAFAYPFACVASMLSDEMRNEKGAALLAASLFLANSVFPVWIPAFQDVIWMSARPRETYLSSTEARVGEVINEYADESEPIIVHGNWNALYNVTGRFAASRYSFQDPIGKIVPEILETFFSEVEENKPKVFVVYHGSFDRERGIEFAEKNGYRFVWRSDDGVADVYVLNPEDSGETMGRDTDEGI